MKILVVDDSRTMRMIISKALSQLGMKDIAEASDGREALDLFNAGSFDAILSDWNMPNMNGLEFLKKIREINKSVPFIMITTEAERSSVIAAVQAGVTDYVVKPFTQDALKNKLEQRIVAQS